jgi:Flp pilus assembly pilin Flp
MVEYSLLVALIAIVAIASLQALGNTTSDKFAKIVTELGGTVE